MMMVRSVKMMAIALAALMLIPLAASAAGPVGSFIKIEGDVDILSPGMTQTLPARIGYPVSVGDAIRTKRNSKAEVQFKDESVIQLAPETRITIDEYSFRSDTVRERGFLGLLRGKVRAIVSKIKTAVIPASLSDAGFNIKTPTAVAGVKGTDFLVYYERGVTGVIFLEGLGFVYNPGKPDQVVPVKGGQATFVMSSDEAPLDAQPVSDALIAPHLKDTTIAMTAAENVGGLEVQTIKMPVITVEVAAGNMTYTVLTDQIIPDGQQFPQQDSGGGWPVVIDTYGGLTMSDALKAPVIPATETDPKLLVTPVTVTVAVP